MRVHGYTTLMAPEIMRLPYLEALYSWSKLCEKIHICFSTFPKFDIVVPEGAAAPWEDTVSLDILKKFDEEILGNKLVINMHEWDITEPLEDGITKQIARTSALDAIKDDHDAWIVQFDADEMIYFNAVPKLRQIMEEDNQNELIQRRPFIGMGIMELFGGLDKVRFNWANWVKIRLTRNIRELEHGLPLRLGPMRVRDRNPRTGKIISYDNRDDGAGFISSLSLSRPNFQFALWATNPEVIQGIMNLRHEPMTSAAWQQMPFNLFNSFKSEPWIFHTSWINFENKWRMGWFFDNFWAVLTGKQDTFLPENKPEFTPRGAPQGEELNLKIKEELERQEVKTLPEPVDLPESFEIVNDWRKEQNLDRPYAYLISE